MKILKLIDGTTKQLQDDEAQNVKNAVMGGLKFVELRDGTFVNTGSISTIQEPQKAKYWSTYRVYTQANGVEYIIRDGQKLPLSEENKKEITLKEEPEIKFEGRLPSHDYPMLEPVL